MKISTIVFTSIIISTNVFATKTEDAKDKTVASFVEETRTVELGKLEQQISMAQSFIKDLENKSLVLLLGNTGAGKSTLANLLSDVDLEPGARGRLQLKDNANGLTMGSGCDSVTKYPQYLSSNLGHICDCPGFQDSDGPLVDIINATVLNKVLKHAKNFKVILVTSQSEIESTRGQSFKNVLQNIRMFSSDFRCSSVCLVINQVKDDWILSDLQGWLEENISDDTVKNWFENGRVIAIPRGENIDILSFMKTLYKDEIGKIVDSLDEKEYCKHDVEIRSALNFESKSKLKELWGLVLLTHLDTESSQWPTLSKAVSDPKNNEILRNFLRDHFKDSLKQSPNFEILNEICEEEFRNSWQNFYNASGPLSSALDVFISKRIYQQAKEAEEKERARRIRVESDLEDARAARRRAEQNYRTVYQDRVVYRDKHRCTIM